MGLRSLFAAGWLTVSVLGCVESSTGEIHIDPGTSLQTPLLSSAGQLCVADSISADLVAIDPGNDPACASDASDRGVVLVKGYSSAGDGGGGIFYWKSGATTSANGGTVVAPTTCTGCTGGRWFRQHQTNFFDARWFGATNDCSTDDHQGIEDAIEAAADAGGGTVYFPGGAPSDCYLVKTTIGSLVGSSNVTLKGDKGASRVKIDIDEGNGFNWGGAKNLVIRDLTFYSRDHQDAAARAFMSSGESGASNCGGSVNSVCHIRIEDCEFYHFSSRPWRVNVASSNLWAVRNYVHDIHTVNHESSSFTHGVGIDPSYVSHAFYVDNRIEGVSDSASSHAIYMSGPADDVVISGNIIEGSSGIKLSASGSRFVVKGNIVRDSNDGGIILANGTGYVISGNSLEMDSSSAFSIGVEGDVSDVVVADNVISGSSGTGKTVSINNAARLTLRGNVISNSASEAISVLGDTDLSISGNVIGSGNLDYGIRTNSSTVDRVSVSNNIVHAPAKGGIHIRNGGEDNVAISDNLITGVPANKVAIDADASTETSGAVVVRDNQVQGVGSSYALLGRSTRDVTLVGNHVFGSRVTLSSALGSGTTVLDNPTDGGRLVVLTFSSSITPDLHTENGIFHITLTGNTTLNAPSFNGGGGKRMSIVFEQDSTGSRTVDLSAYNVPSGVVVDPAASATTVMQFEYDGTNWNYVGQ